MPDNPRAPTDKPTYLDYSEATAQKVALSNSVQHPLTLWPTALGILGATGAALFGTFSMPAVIGIAIGGAGVGAANWAINYYLLREANTQAYYNDLHKRFETMKAGRIAQLTSDLKRLGCDQGVEHVQQFEAKIANLKEVLCRVLSPTELTFSRFMGNAEQVYESGIKNLGRVVNLLTNIRDIDRMQLKKKINSLEKIEERSKSDETLLNAFKRRADDYDTSMKEIDELLAENEQALTAIGEAGSAAVRIGDREASITPQEKMSEAMDLLGQMVSRAKAKPSLVTLLDEDKK